MRFSWRSRERFLGSHFDRLFSVYGETAIFLVALPLIIGLLYYAGSASDRQPHHRDPAWSATDRSLAVHLRWHPVLRLCSFHPRRAGINPPFSDANFTPTTALMSDLALTGLITLGLLMIAIDLLATLQPARPGMAWRRAPLSSPGPAIVTWFFVVIALIFLAAISMPLIDRLYDGGFSR